MRLILIIILFIGNELYSQEKYILYRSDVAYISNNEINPGYKHFIYIKKNKGVMFVTKQKTPKTTSEIEHILLFRKQNMFRYGSYIISQNHCLINEKSNSKWIKINHQPVSDSITYTKVSKEINGYLCKQALIKRSDGVTEVWYTDEIKYNWLFKNIFQKIPGTIVLAKLINSDVVLLELLEINVIDDSSSFICKSSIKSILNDW